MIIYGKGNYPNWLILLGENSRFCYCVRIAIKPYIWRLASSSGWGEARELHEGGRNRRLGVIYGSQYGALAQGIRAVRRI
jgi:hypothetical protein